MRLLNDWISESLLQAIGWTLVHSIWQLVLISALLWAGLKLVNRSKPSLKYALAVGALVISFVAAGITFFYEIQLDNISVQEVSVSEFELLFDSSQIGSESVGIDFGVRKATFWIDRNLPMLVNFWFLGMILFLFRLINSLSEIRSLRKSSSPVSDFQIERIIYRIAGKLGIKTNVQLRTTDSGVSPMTFGTFKPILLLPAGLIFQLSPAQLEAIIAHELAHIKRNDYLINLLLSGLEVIFFFHPCYWWMNNTVKELRENAADDLVMKAGIAPKTLATGLAEVLNFAKQNPPELALAAGKKRNPTLQRIKRILGYPAQNYPQNPIISIPMLLTLILSAGLMATAQQDKPELPDPIENHGSLATVFVQDTIRGNESPKSMGPISTEKEKNVMVISDKGYSYKISGDTLISGKDTIFLSGDAKVKLDQLRAFDWSDMPEMEVSVPPLPPMEFETPPMPDFEMEFPMDMTAFAIEPMMSMEPFDFSFEMVPPMPPMVFFSDTTKMSKEERVKWTKEMEDRSKEWAKVAEERAGEWAKRSEEMAKRSEEWAAKWEEGSTEREAKIEAWKKEFEPKMKEFELKMKEWQEAQEPKMKEFEKKIKEWEVSQKPKMEEFQKRMEVWQKEHEAKLQEFQKLVQSELNKENKNN